MGSPSQTSRLPNLSSFDEVVLCHAYCKYSIDGKTGTNQRGGTMWEKIQTKFNNTEGVLYHRSIKVLQGKWTTINRDCMLYSAKMTRAFGATRGSGTSRAKWVSPENNFIHIYHL